MKRTILAALLICLFVTVQAQKVKTAPAQTGLKTFVVNAATAKNLPKEVVFKEDKIYAQPGFKFEKLATGGYKIVDIKNVSREVSGTFKCNCKTPDPKASCSPVFTKEGALACSGTSCCGIEITIDYDSVKMY